MKIFYSTVMDPSEVLERESNKIEELRLPNHALKRLQTDLTTSTNTLPHSARTHREWTIGLLDRWTPVP